MSNLIPRQARSLLRDPNLSRTISSSTSKLSRPSNRTLAQPAVQTVPTTDAGPLFPTNAAKEVLKSNPSVLSSVSSVLHRTTSTTPPIAIGTEDKHYILTNDGRRIFDAVGGAVVISIGHKDERVTRALIDQLNKVSFVHSGLFTSEPAEELASLLIKDGPFERALFVNGGSEAVECAIKLARQFHIENGQPERVNFIGRKRSYHGNTLGGLSVGNHTSRRAPYEPILSQSAFHHVSPCYAYRYKLEDESDERYVARLADELEAKFQELGPGTVAAFFAETVVGATTGCVPPVPGYFKAMREVCDRHGALLVLDEIMCGVGRTGKFHAWEHEGVTPDIQTIGKGLGGGFEPVSSILITSRVISAFQKGSGSFENGFTFQSHALACRAGVEVMKILKEDKLIENCAKVGEILEAELRGKVGKLPWVGDIRGRGLFWGVEFVKDKATKEPLPRNFNVAPLIVSEALSRGLAVYPGAKGTIDGVDGDHVLVSPPYTVTEEEMVFLARTLAESIEAVFVRSGY